VVVLRALIDWMTGATPSPTAPPTDGDPTRTRARIGRYSIERKLGQGGMGVVYAAKDERLERVVALKTMTALAADQTARKRFWREARAAAAVNHPNVCQLYEIGEENGELFIAMELLDGESLSERLKRGALSVADTVPIGLGILSALSALHARGIVHRDLKPSNVFLTPHGVKLLDFGLARPAETPAAESLSTGADLTGTGIMVGTPRYMAPEQIAGEALDARSDLFAAGAILFEMLAGRPAFSGRTMVEILHATLHEHPPALTGSPAIAAADRVIRRALAKRREERHASADAMADELRAVKGVSGDDTPALARALTRLVVLPFRVLRPDPETDFLAFSLPDAIATSLSGIGSLVVRSSATAARFATDAPDLKALAAEADVDRVVMGTLLRSGEQLRAVAQLVEAPAGTLITSQTVQASLGDLFRLQDDIAHRVVEALALPLGGKASAPPSPAPDAPRDARAYELYLRANELARSYDGLVEARDLYARAVEIDPGFAPAWAHLGRAHRVFGKYIEPSPGSLQRAEDALKRALDLNPRLTVAHKFYAQLEGDLGRSERAMVRLLKEAGRHGNDPELFAGLVHACRYCGLFEQALAAHDEARRLDPNIPTSYRQTVLMTCDFDRVLGGDGDQGSVASGEDVIRVIALGFGGRLDEARALLDRMRDTVRVPAFKVWTRTLYAWLDRDPKTIHENRANIGPLSIMDDPEASFQEGWLLCDAGDHQAGLASLKRAVDKGYAVAPTLAAAPQFDKLRGDPAFRALVKDAEEARARAAAAFREAGGDRLLGNLWQWEGRFQRLQDVLEGLKSDAQG
jgi:serine/threonine protein kinase/tetratricopeptide (TPR) repeat protein